MDDNEEAKDMIEDEPITVANNENDKNINLNRKETIMEDTPQAITGMEAQESTNKSNNKISRVAE